MELNDIFLLFADSLPKEYELKDSSHGEKDFREAVFVTYEDDVLPKKYNDRLVIKLADNGFTDSEHLLMWERLALEYRKRGFYCPEFVRTKNGDFPTVRYKDHNCIVFAEEYSQYKTAESFDTSAILSNGKYNYLDEALRMNAEIASAHFDFTVLPSAYAMFELFDPNDQFDEVMENAQAWLNGVKSFPPRFKEQIDHIWERFSTNREYLRSRYEELPTSIFQADINRTNVLLNENGDFVGVLDFNIAGKDTFLNYFFREIPYVYGEIYDPSRSNTEELNLITGNEEATSCIVSAINIVKKYYTFSDAERELALPMYRCVRPLWYPTVGKLGEAQTDEDRQKLLDDIEQMQTTEIDFYNLMK